MADIVIVKSDQEKTVEVHPGDTISIRLDENPATGYRWEAGPVESQILELLDSVYSMGAGGGIGGGGTRTFRYRARSIGTERLELRNRRAWEPGDRALEWFEVKICVQSIEKQ